MEYDNRGNVSLWKNDSDNERAPILNGKVVAHRNIGEGETLDISLWKNNSENERAPALTGKINDPWKIDESATPVAKDDDIPF